MKNNSFLSERKLLALLCGASAALSSVKAAEFTGPSTTIAPYVTSSVFDIVSIRSVADGTSFGLPQMVGIPDGLGAYDNNDGTFSVLMNHELTPTAGGTRAHGATGAFVSRWVINKSDFSVLSISDQIQQVSLWDTGTSSFLAPATGPLFQFNRLCSADLPLQSAFQFGGLGTANRIFMNGEEAGAEGRAFAHILNGPGAGISYQLPHLGRFSWENSVASPFAQQKTIVMGLDDTAVQGQVYMYVGNKQAVGNDIERAGLVGGSLYGVKVTGATNDTTTGPGFNGTFTMALHSGSAANQTGAQVNSNSVALGAFNFNRPEDGAWDTRAGHENEFYFVTTAGTTTASRLYRLTFTDVSNPELGGVISCLLDGTEGQIMADNISVGPDGIIMIQEDPGGNNRLSKIWAYDIATDSLTEAAAFKSSLFAPTPGAIFNNDEESSGIIDISDILGYRAYLADAQVHTGTGNPLTVENGQLFLLREVPEPSIAALSGLGFLLALMRFRRKLN